MRKKQKINNNLPMILIILDGWGIAKPSRGNAITLARTPNIDYLYKHYPATKMGASGRFVGLPLHQDGNSEAGHMNIGAGRVVEQDVVRISHSIDNGAFFKNPAFLEAVRHAKKNRSRVHLMGMLGNNMSAHSDPDHILALITMLREKGVNSVSLHLFTDGRDSPKHSALKLVGDLERILSGGEIVSTIMGRFYAMDRRKRWKNTEKAYNALVLGVGRAAESSATAITDAYNRGEDDEFCEPYVITKNNKPAPRINDGDSIIFFNLRSDRARQITKVFTQTDFNKMNPGSFKRKKVLNDLKFVAMTDFGPDLDGILSAFPSPDLRNTLPMQLKDLRQLYIAESEKYAHVTYFFNGGYTGVVAGEDRMMIPSPDVKFYDKVPEMGSAELTKTVVNNLSKRKYDFTVLNFAAPDMIGHTGNLMAAVKCCESIDKYVGEIVESYLRVGGTILITADHGNIEEMINLETDTVKAEHSTNPVPFIVVNKVQKKISSGLSGNKIKLRRVGVLGDIAPTILDLIGFDIPTEMTGKSLIRK